MIILVTIWLTIFIIDVALTGLMVLECNDAFRRKYPELKMVKKHWSVEVVARARLVLYALLPLFQIGMLWSLIAHHDEMVERAVHKTYLECMEEERNAQKTSNISDSSET